MKENALKHLAPQVHDVIDCNSEDRIQWLRQNRWIGYDAANYILGRIEDLMHHPKVPRMPNLLILGHTNNGKTTIIERLLKRHPADDDIQADYVKVPVLAIKAPPLPDESRLYDLILEKLFAPYKTSDKVSRKQIQVVNTLKKIGTKILVIDEIQDIIAGRYEKQRQFLNVLKFLGNELQIPIVGVGTKEALRAIHADPQMSNRFEPIALPAWQLNKDFQKLLASYERILPLRLPSKLHLSPISSRLFALSEGIIGELSRLLNLATIKAIESGTEQITIEIIDSLNWSPPSQRKHKAEMLL